MKKLVLFGDSITAGYGREAISPILQEMLAKKWETDKGPQIINAGLPGDTSVDGLKRIEKDVLIEQADLVIVFFGANDTNADRGISVEVFCSTIGTMIQRIGADKVILVTPPYVACARRPSWNAWRIQQYGQQLTMLGEKQNIPVVPLYQQMVISNDPEKYLQIDGLHFSKEGYNLLADLLIQTIQTK